MTTKSASPLLSIVVPAYNEMENLPELYRQLTAVFEELSVRLEIVVVDDASTDGSLEWLRRISQKDSRVRFVSFSRNFGHQAGVTAGLQYATGDAVVVMDADLQDPPQVLPLMFERWREGYQVIMGRRARRDVDPFSKRLFAWIYYRVLSQLSQINIPLDGGDFCLMDRAVVDTLNRLPERHRYVRGLRAWAGFRYIDVPFDRQQRFGGEPKYNFFKSLALAIDGLVSFSQSPLRFATYTGLATGAIALFIIVLVIYWCFFTNSPLVGYATVVAIFLFISSVQMITFGIMGEYVGRIYDEVKGRPHYIVREISPIRTTDNSAISHDNNPDLRLIA